MQWQYSTDLCDKNLSGTATDMGRLVAYLQAHDLFVPSLNIIKKQSQAKVHCQVVRICNGLLYIKKILHEFVEKILFLLKYKCRMFRVYNTYKLYFCFFLDFLIRIYLHQKYLYNYLCSIFSSELMRTMRLVIIIAHVMFN